MRVVIIDNGSGASGGAEHLDRLQEICTRHEVQVLPADGLDGADAAIGSAEVLVFAGTYGNGLVWEKPYFMQEMELLRLTDKPVLGAGLGFELLCYAFGCQLHELSELETAAGTLRPTDDGAKVFQGTDPLKVSEDSRWTVEELPKDLVVLARSDSGIEAIRHKSRPLYGLQLLPQDFKYASDGKMVFDNILDTFRKQAGR